MKARIENNTLIIEVPVSPEPSGSGKGVHVYCSHGWQLTDCEYRGAKVSISLNATCRLKDIKVAAYSAVKHNDE